jgi:hypothetical protein
MVGDELRRLCAEVLDCVRLGIVTAIYVHPNEVISKDAFEKAHVISDNGFSPVGLGLSYVGSVAGMITRSLDIRQGRDEQEKR